VRVGSQVVNRSKVRVVKMLVVVVVVFAFCWLPLYAVNVRIFFGSPLDVDEAEFQLLTQTVIPVAQWIGLSSCAVNPVVYCLFSAKFRDGFRKVLVAEQCCGAPACSAQRRWSATGHRRWSAGFTTALVDNKPITSRHATVALEMQAVSL